MLVFSLVLNYEKGVDYFLFVLFVSIVMWFSVVLLVFDFGLWYLWGLLYFKLNCYGFFFLLVVILLEYISFWLIVFFLGSCGFFLFFGSFLVRLYEKFF